nr:Late embryogenesis abundant protein, LEA-14 [Ipomoea batatas]GME12381.1 Late embryogenesis abundant protein, LEA-14 [Ipomoea batatas]
MNSRTSESTNGRIPHPPLQGHHHYYPPPHSSSSSSKASFKGCCCCLFLLFTFMALLVIAVILVIVLALKPKKPQFDLQQVGVQYVGIKYDESRFTVMYRGIPLGRGIVPAFYQPAHSIRRVETTIVVDRVSLLQTDADALVRDAMVNDRVELRVLGDVGAKVRILGFTSPGVEVSVDCTIAISPRKQALTSKQCGFDGLSV